MKNLIFYCFYPFVSLCTLHAQDNGELIGKWKFVKVELESSVSFDLDNLTATYKKFFDKQKREVYHDAITTNDSLYIQVQFEKIVNDVSRMFIEFKSNNRYETNGYNRSGNMTEKPETGTYFYNKGKRIIHTYLNGDKRREGKFKVVFLDKVKLVIISDPASRPATFTCRRVKE